MPNKQKKEILHVITNCNDLRKYVEAAKMILENLNLDHQAYEALVVYAEHYDAKTSRDKKIRLKAKRFLAEKLPNYCGGLAQVWFKRGKRLDNLAFFFRKRRRKKGESMI